MTPRPLPAALLLATAALALAAAPAATKPATGDLVSIGGDLVRFYAPPAPTWTVRQTRDASPDRIFFLGSGARAAIQVEVAPPDFQIAGDTAGPIAASIVKTLKEKRQRDANEVVLPATIEHDHRFDIVIHERFRVGDAVQDMVHLYKSVGPRTVMAVASTVSDDPAAVAATFAAAETSVASAKYNKKAAVRPPR